ncbi:hypothetical protein M9H77_16734 [Catharanthus roseus]|uniref:Uncharacterized protein n=1 Tax=Catharanthus roseus TaxID=4058 RepID=A0ACC0B2L6_CATRO|nr:hypothetical protein M9H77_16734 [Catharanthus roseus]
MRVSSAARKSERIKTHQRIFYNTNLKEHVMRWGSTDKVRIPQNEAIGTKFRHLVVKYQPNNIRVLNYKQLHSHINSQNRLQTPGAPTRSALGPTSISSPSRLSTRRPNHNAKSDAVST